MAMLQMVIDRPYGYVLHMTETLFWYTGNVARGYIFIRRFTIRS